MLGASGSGGRQIGGSGYFNTGTGELNKGLDDKHFQLCRL